MSPHTVVVVDDHPMFREGLAGLIDVLADATLVGQAGSGEEALPIVAATDPDVVLMDLHMPGMGGIEATRRIAADHPRTAVLVLTMLRDDASIVAAMQAGARGYLLKEATPDEIRRAVAAVAGGRARPAGMRDLTEREHEILDLLAGGLTNSAIAGRLFLSEKTVRNYVSQLFAKLGVGDRAAAVAKARDAGYGPPSSSSSRS